MFKILLGAAIVVGLVGYGVITTDDIEDAGRMVKNTVNAGASYVKERTDPSLQEQFKITVEELKN